MATKEQTLATERRTKTILSVVLAIICVIYCLPVVAVVINSFKGNTFVKTETFALPNEQSFVGFDNFIKGMTFGNFFSCGGSSRGLSLMWYMSRNSAWSIFST